MPRTGTPGELLSIKMQQLFEQRDAQNNKKRVANEKKGRKTPSLIRHLGLLILNLKNFQSKDWIPSLALKASWESINRSTEWRPSSSTLRDSHNITAVTFGADIKTTSMKWNHTGGYFPHTCLLSSVFARGFLLTFLILSHCGSIWQKLPQGLLGNPDTARPKSDSVCLTPFHVLPHCPWSLTNRSSPVTRSRLGPVTAATQTHTSAGIVWCQRVVGGSSR